jgi:hypothetical protein
MINVFTFKSPAISKNIWKLCFRDRDEMNRIFYEGRAPEDDTRIHGITEYVTSTIYIDKDLDGFLLAKTLRHELTHVYLWETGQQSRINNEEETCDLLSVAAPAICKTTDEILLRLKEGLYKNGE